MIRFLLSLSLFAATAGLPASADEAGPPRQTLLEKPVTLASPAIKAKVIKVTFPPGFKTPLHTHEGPGPRYVVKGQVKIEEGGESHVYGAGEVFWETGNWMTAENVSGTDAAEMVIFELAPQ